MRILYLCKRQRVVTMKITATFWDTVSHRLVDRNNFIGMLVPIYQTREH